MTAHWSLVLNGKSRDDAQDAAVLDAAIARIRGRGIRLDVREIRKPGDARQHVDQAVADHVDCIISGGGDGTLSAVASALAARDTTADLLPALGLVPLGTGNDFADAAGIPCDIEAALELVRTHPARRIDLLRIDAGGHNHWCANMVTGGFGATATVETSDALKRSLGGFAYLVTGIAELGKRDPEPARLRGPDFDWKGDFIALGLGNGRQAGGGQVLCVRALIDDGLLDVTIVPELSGELAATLARTVTQGKQAALAEVAVQTRLPWIELTSPQTITLNLDGEPIESDHFRIECVRGRLRMHLPGDCPLLSDPATVGP